MPAKKTMKKTAKKTAKPVAKTIEKKCDCAEKCACKDCKCGGHSQLPIYLLVGMLVATLTVLMMFPDMRRDRMFRYPPSPDSM